MQDPSFAYSDDKRVEIASPASLTASTSLTPTQRLADPERLQTLSEYRILDSLPEPNFDELARLASKLLNTPIAAVTLLDDKRQWFKSCVGVSMTEIPQEIAFCRYTLLQEDPTIVPDATRDARFADNPLVTDEPFIRFYAGAPLLTPEGQAIGTLCILDTTPREMTGEQIEILSVLSRQVMAQLEVRRQIHGLSESRQWLARREYDFRMLAEHAPDAILRVDLMGRFQYVNPQGERLLGTAAGSFMGKTCAEIGLPPAQCALFQDSIARAVRGGHSLEEECTMPVPEGVRVMHKVIVPEFGKQGAVETVIIVARDVTEHRQKEARALAEARDRSERDNVTGLMNHRGFQICFQQALETTQGPLTVLLLDIANFKFFNDVHGIAAGDTALRLAAQTLQEYFRDAPPVARYGGDEFAVLLHGLEADAAPGFLATLAEHLSMLAFPTKDAGVIVPIHMTAATATYPQDALTRHALQEIAGTRLAAAKSGDAAPPEIEELRRGLTQSRGGFRMLNALLAAVDNKDRYTRRHSEDVLTYSLGIARALEMETEAQITLQIAALLHDIGKIGVPDSILRKPGALTEEEFEAVKQHPMMGAVIVQAVPGFEGTLDAIRHHHERWDGGGYPFGLAGAEIPLAARIMAVADAFSAMTMDRPYRKGMCPEQAFAILRDGAGAQWDAGCVEAFLRSRQTPRA